MEDKKERKLTAKHYVIIAVALIIVIYAGFAIHYSGVYTQGTKINGVNVSGKSVAEVTTLFEEKAKAYSLTIKERKNQTEAIESKDIELSFSGKEELEKIKKNQNPVLWITGLFGGEKHSDVPIYTYNQGAVEKTFKNLECFNKKNITKIVNAKPVYKDGKFVVQKEVNGNVLNSEKALKAVETAIQSGSSKIDLDKSDCYEKPKYTKDSQEIKDLAKKMNQSLKGSITYKFGKQTVVLDKDVYAKWFTIKNDTDFTISSKKLENWVMKFAYKYNTLGTMRTFKTHDGRKEKIFGGSYGWRVSREKEEKAVKKMITEGTTTTREPYWRQKAVVYDGVQGDIGNTYAEVDIANQTVYVYKNGKQVFATSCVTGKMSEGRQTPSGVYAIMYKQSSATLNGQGYSSPVKYWMPFASNVGFHSASWRSSFGGSIYINDGSHGCVNLPTYAAQTLFSLLQKDTPVVVYY